MSELGREEITRVLGESLLPVVSATAGEAKKISAQEMLNEFISSVQRDLEQVVVPPYTREGHYNYAKLIAQREQVEAALLPLLEQNAMLEAELARETADLASDEAYFEELKKNAKRQGQVGGGTRLANSLLQSCEPKCYGDTADEIAYRPPRQPPSIDPIDPSTEPSTGGSTEPTNGGSKDPPFAALVETIAAHSGRIAATNPPAELRRLVSACRAVENHVTARLADNSQRLRARERPTTNRPGATQK